MAYDKVNYETRPSTSCSASQCNADVRRQPQVQEALEGVKRWLEELGAITNKLRDSLGVICRPAEPATAAKCPESGSNVPLARVIDDMAYELKDLHSSLDDLLQRIEV